jgi:Flp pilus assembly protein TadG
MNRPSQKAKRTVSRIFWRSKSGQALIEFTGVIVLLLLLIFGAIDFCRAIYLRQVLVNLSRETANLEARGTGTTTQEIMTNALNAAIQEALPLALDSSNGMVIVTAVTNNFGSGKKGSTAGFVISQQYTAGTLGASSAIGTGNNNPAWLPVTSILPSNRTVYVAEVYYHFTPITPVGKFINAALPKQFYDVAYFSAL